MSTEGNSLLQQRHRVEEFAENVVEEERHLEQKVQTLEQQVQGERREMHALTLENAELRQEVRRWAAKGAQVKEREAEALRELKRAYHDGPSTNVTSQVETREEADLRSELQLPAAPMKRTSRLKPAMLLVVQIGVLLVMATVAWYCWATYAPTKWAALRATVMGEKVLEISELQVGDLPAMPFSRGHDAEDHYLKIMSGGAPTPFRTSSVEQTDGSSLLRFPEVYNISVRRKDGPCVIDVFQRGDPHDRAIGRSMVSTGELLARISDAGRGGRYIRLPLEPLPGSWLHHHHSATDCEPYVALRAREVSRDIISKQPSLLRQASYGATNAAFRRGFTLS